MASRTTPEILSALEQRGLLEYVQAVANQLGVNVGELVAPSGKHGRRARALLWHRLLDRLPGSTICAVFGVERHILRNELVSVAASEAVTIPPPGAA